MKLHVLSFSPPPSSPPLLSLSRPYNSKNPFLAPLKVIRELHKGGDRSCMHIEMDITGSKLSYVAGDHVAIFPSNDPQLVNRIGELLDVDLDTVFTLTNVDGEYSSNITLEIL